MRHARQHEGVLHVDHDQRGARRIEIVMDVLAAAPRNHAIDDRLRNGDLVHQRLLVIAGGGASCAGVGRT